MNTSPVRWLVLVLCIDGAGVAGVSVVALSTGRMSLAWLATVAAAGWALALAGVPDAVRRRTPEVVRVARIRVVAGMAVTSVGAPCVLLAFPSIVWPATALAVAGVVVSLAYLALLRRLRPV